MGTSMVALAVPAARRSSGGSPPSPPPCCSRSARRTCTSRASPARTSTSPRSRSAMLVVDVPLLRRARAAAHPAAFGALLALSFATKESTFITIFVAGSVLPGRDRRGRRARRAALREAPIVRTLLGVGWEPLRVGRRPRSSASTRVAVHDVLHAPERRLRALTGLDYWLGQHDVGRGGEPPVFYAVAAVRARVAGAAARRRRRGRRVPAPDAAAAVPGLGVRASRWSSTRGRARSSPGWCCTRCCR